MKRKPPHKSGSAPRPAAEPKAPKRTARSWLNLLTPYLLPVEKYPQMRLRKQNNFISQWIDFA